MRVTIPTQLQEPLIWLSDSEDKTVTRKICELIDEAFTKATTAKESDERNTTTSNHG